MNLEKVWEIREEKIYPDLFGEVCRGIFPLSAETFRRFGDIKTDPRWFSHGVMEFRPSPTRDTWLYVTSGYSNPWETEPEEYDEDQESGAGVEFVLETLEQGDWPIVTLQNMLAFDMLLATGQLGSGSPLDLHDRIPLHAPIDGRESTEIRFVVLCEPENFPPRFKLPSGTSRFLQFVGITEAERDFAKQSGFDALRQQLKEHAHYPATVPGRASCF